MHRRYRILIIGAGVAGLTAAIALQRAGHDVHVYERQESVTSVGAGLSLWNNATAALRELGLFDDVERIGAPLGYGHIMRPDGRILSTGDMSTFHDLTGTPVLAVHRGELMPLLESRLSAGTMRFGYQLDDYEVRDGRVIAKFTDGSTEEGDVLLGADGIWSSVRRRLHGEEPARYSGYLAWRSVIDFARMSSSSPLASTETWGRGRRFGWVPLSRNRVYWFATRNAPRDSGPGPDGNKPELLELFGDWHSPIPETLAATDEAGILRHDIYDRLPTPNWGRGPVTLVGDAAHPMTPNTGQGAATAIEDALVLADSLARYQTIDAALRAYEATRYPRVKFITDLSRRIGQISQVENAAIRRVRDAIVQATPASMTERQLRQLVDWTPPRLD